MLISAALALALSAASPAFDQATAPVQAPQVAAPEDPTGVVDLGDITVSGRRLEEATQEYIREVSAPARGRGLARWRDGVCVGVVNLQNDLAQYIVDRVSTVAEDLGLTPGDPGCEPSVLIIATVNANAFTKAFVERRPKLFIVGGGGMDQGYSGLARFKTNDQPVRWWTVSLPVNAETGVVATRLPGEEEPYVRTTASRLTTSIADDTKRAFVILDMDKIAGVPVQHLSDYLAMVVLAQVNPDADTSGYSTVLNLFKDGSQTEGLTDWDKAYLEGLYDTNRTRRSLASHRQEIASSIIRVHNRMTAEQIAAEDAAAQTEAPATPTP
jgi:hypothetical protein